MKTSLDRRALAEYLERQLATWFPDGNPVALENVVPRALDRLALCFAPVKLGMYRRDGETYFDHLHTDQYATFLYFASNVAHHRGDSRLAAKLYGLNKALNGCMCTFDTELPAHVLLIHTVGLMLGKATYGDYLVAVHGATVGTDRGTRPVLGRGVVLFGGCAVIGGCEIADNVTIAAHALVRNERIPAGQIVAGGSPSLIVKPASRALITEFFDVEAR